MIVGGFCTQGVGIVDSLRAGTIMRERAQEKGALQVFANTEVLGIDVENGRVKAMRTTRGTIETEIVVVCCGVWSPKIARMAGASIPLTPAVHQMINVGPVPHFKDTKGVIEFPIVRDMDTNMYERQDGSGLEIGSYAHRPILHDPEEIPSNEESALSPTELPFTEEDFEQQMERRAGARPGRAERRVGRDQVRDQRPALADAGRSAAPRRDTRGEGALVGGGRLGEGGAGRREGGRGVDDARRVGDRPAVVRRRALLRCQKTRANIRARAAEGFNKTYGIVHPSEQWESNRRVRLSPYYEREQELGAVFYEAAAWERPHWYESNAKLLEEYGDRINRREAEWESRWWSPIINAEHLAMRDRAAMFDLSAFCIFDVTGPGALDDGAAGRRCGR